MLHTNIFNAMFFLTNSHYSSKPPYNTKILPDIFRRTNLIKLSKNKYIRRRMVVVFVENVAENLKIISQNLEAIQTIN